ncbi:Pre-rRNA-processing protein esf2 [Penicillium diatomitis]|uniref:Pre-rRNA-processing protein ESF2 n=1 Tax=Penicillium diatomitis TaxID=2819901 RepID=A0A9X0BXZ0_9EURO|nr:Pre-rRNA-processing protein esf2 [Penicillium diatomitis]KAJ5488667.1 Pre-rRNA-processing protein esf2 [Penicillium diatomitis]
MTTRKHNEFLDVASDEDEVDVRGYSSEENDAKSKGRAVKKRRTDTQDFFGLESDEDLSEEEEDETSRSDVKGKGRKQLRPKTKSAGTSSQDVEREETDADEDDEHKEGDEKEHAKDDHESPEQKKFKKVLSTKLLKKPKKDKSGVVYLSSLPPYLKPFALKNIMEKRGFGPIRKVFFAPLVPSNSSSQRKSNKRKLYSEGWIEFESKKTARLAAEAMNARPLGGPKGMYYRDDVINMRYLSGFKWADLMETVQRERSERESKQRMADIRARKEEKVFLAGVEAGRRLDGITQKNEEKRKRKAEAEGQVEGDKKEPKMPAPVRRRFVQNDVVTTTQKSEKAIDNDAKRVLGKIF